MQNNDETLMTNVNNQTYDVSISNIWIAHFDDANHILSFNVNWNIFKKKFTIKKNQIMWYKNKKKTIQWYSNFQFFFNWKRSKNNERLNWSWTTSSKISLNKCQFTKLHMWFNDNEYFVNYHSFENVVSHLWSIYAW